MRKINEIILHCSATPNHMDIGVKEITDWHVNGNGWNDIGYHIVIRRDGTIEDGRPINKIGSHCYGHNRHSIGICLVGEGKTHESFTELQYEALQTTIASLMQLYPTITKVTQHSDYDSKKPFCAGLTDDQLFFYNNLFYRT